MMKIWSLAMIICLSFISGCKSKEDLISDIHSLRQQKESISGEIKDLYDQIEKIKTTQKMEDNLTWKDVNATFLELEKQREQVFSIIKEKTEKNE